MSQLHTIDGQVQITHCHGFYTKISTLSQSFGKHLLITHKRRILYSIELKINKLKNQKGNHASHKQNHRTTYRPVLFPDTEDSMSVGPGFKINIGQNIPAAKNCV